MPKHLRPGSNERRLRYLRQQLYRVIETELTQDQRDCVLMHYWQGMLKKDIARTKRVSCGQVTKYIQAAEKSIENHLKNFLKVYDSLERELLDEL